MDKLLQDAAVELDEGEAPRALLEERPIASS